MLTAPAWIGSGPDIVPPLPLPQLQACLPPGTPRTIVSGTNTSRIPEPPKRPNLHVLTSNLIQGKIICAVLTALLGRFTSKTVQIRAVLCSFCAYGYDNYSYRNNRTAIITTLPPQNYPFSTIYMVKNLVVFLPFPPGTSVAYKSLIDRACCNRFLHDL